MRAPLLRQLHGRRAGVGAGPLRRVPVDSCFSLKQAPKGPAEMGHVGDPMGAHLSAGASVMEAWTSSPIPQTLSVSSLKHL